MKIKLCSSELRGGHGEAQDRGAGEEDQQEAGGHHDRGRDRRRAGPRYLLNAYCHTCKRRCLSSWLLLDDQTWIKHSITYCRCGVRSQISGWCSPSRVRSRPSSCRRALLSAAAGDNVLLTAVNSQNFAKHFASLEQVCGEHSREFSRWVLAPPSLTPLTSKGKE